LSEKNNESPSNINTESPSNINTESPSNININKNITPSENEEKEESEDKKKKNEKTKENENENEKDKVIKSLNANNNIITSYDCKGNYKVEGKVKENVIPSLPLPLPLSVPLNNPWKHFEPFFKWLDPAENTPEVSTHVHTVRTDVRTCILRLVSPSSLLKIIYLIVMIVLN
jgi:hypothetical protein